MENYNTEDILRESQVNVKKLNEKLKDIEKLHNEIKESVSLSLKNPVLFKELALKLNDSAELYLKGNNNLFDEKIEDISSKIGELGTEITRLIEVDFNILFNDLEKQFLENSINGFEKELVKFDKKANNIQIKIDDFGKEIMRLSEIDLEDHFNKHQNKLSEVFLAINGINNILSNISQNINKIIKNFGEIDETLYKHQKELIRKLDSVISAQQSDKNQVIAMIAASDVKINTIISENEILKKEVSTIKIINYALLVLVIVSIIILVTKL